ncbi:cu-Zn superoxide dismutase [Arthroderma uncinatum]|uniref:cu-Zn superoxide dismutase n=1 Tax=Arthroderma uncinatum TaxID=74035 RepID=UPI00144A63D4|nr:cu-Zn superoxide dismutase [Arthroderma uncinatum]KAF3480199.1 cu-Zn superoxide dismutase [Arthroderma uncinatum]
MKASLFLACSVLSFGLATATGTQDAPETVDNPIGPVYKATLLDKDSTEIRGSISATAYKDGRGVVFEVDLSGFEKDDGPYAYHLHVDPVPEDGNCSKTLDHIDPFGRGQKPPCDTPHPETCEPGDLSGKHGKISVYGNQHFMARYHDLYTSTRPGVGTFFGNRSFVVHNKDGKRMNCGNFKLVHHEDESCSSGSMPTGTISSRAPSGTGVAGAGAATGTGIIPSNTATYNPPSATASLPVFSNGSGRLVGFSLGALVAAIVPFAL